jgi:hypothetical protein
VKILDNSNYDNLDGGGDFSHAYIIMHKYFGKKPKMQRINQMAKIEKSFSLMPFQNGFCSFQNSYVVYYLIK